MKNKTNIALVAEILGYIVKIVELDISSEHIEEVYQAFIGEKEYNNTIFDFNCISYKKQGILTQKPKIN